jgi:prepilin peptidase CpaA
MGIWLFAHFMTISLFMGLLLAAAVGDVKKYRIPNTYSLCMLALYPIFAISAPQPVAPAMSIGVMLAVLVIGFAAFAQGLIGGGDVKIMSAAALYAGPALIADFLIVTALAGGAIALLMISTPTRLGLAAALDSVGNRTLRDALLTNAIPYCVAIAAGGLYLTLRLVALAGGA